MTSPHQDETAAKLESEYSRARLKAALSTLQEEVATLKLQVHAMVHDRESLLREREALRRALGRLGFTTIRLSRGRDGWCFQVFGSEMDDCFVV